MRQSSKTEQDPHTAYWRDKAIQLEQQLLQRSSGHLNGTYSADLPMLGRAGSGLPGLMGRSFSPGVLPMPSGASPAAASLEGMLKSERETSERLRSQVGFLSEQVNQLSRYNLELSEARVSETNQWRIEMGRMMANYKSKNSSELTKTQAELQVALSTIQQLRQQLSMLESRNVEYLTPVSYTHLTLPTIA